MRGRWPHNVFLLGPVHADLKLCAEWVGSEVRIGPGKDSRAVDLCADWVDPKWRVAVEADASDGRRTRVRLDRLRAYVEKADALEADALLIVVRTGRVAAQVRAALRRARVTSQCAIVVYTQPQARSWIARGCGIVVRVKGGEGQGDKKDGTQSEYGRGG